MKLRSLPRIRTDIPGPRSRALASRLRQFESPNITYVSDDFPIVWREAKGCLVKDADRNWFLDLSASFGVCTLGHSHPAILRAIRRQASKLIHGMGDVHPPAIRIHAAREIARRVPVSDAKVIFGLSGSDAVEAALKTAAVATARPGVISFTGAYHGLGYGALHVTDRSDFRSLFESQLGDWSHRAPYPSGDHQIDRSLDVVRALLKQHPIGAVIFEPIQGRAGVIAAPAAWIRELRRLCDESDALLIADEVFTGWGRVGAWTTCDCADLYCLGKSLAGGLPLSACVAPAAIMDAWPKSHGEAIHTSTFLGHPLACAAALTVINEIDRLHLLDRAKQLGEFLRCELDSLAATDPRVSPSRGQGMMRAISLPTREAAWRLATHALSRGVILLPAGDGSVLEFTPPLIVTEAQLMFCIEVIRDWPALPNG